MLIRGKDRFNDNLFLLLNSELLRHVNHLFHGDGAGDLQNPLWTPPYISLALYILSYNCPDDKGSTSLVLCNLHDAEQILDNLREQLGKIHLSLNMDKTRITEAHKGFDFLSFHFIRKYDA